MELFTQQTGPDSSCPQSPGTEGDERIALGSVCSSTPSSPAPSSPTSAGVGRFLQGGSSLHESIIAAAAAAAEQSRSKKEDHIKRPMNPFMVWAQLQRRKMTLEYPEMHNAEISRRLGVIWKKLTDNERAPYIAESERLRALHMEQYPNYKYRPRKKATKKKTGGTSGSQTSGSKSSSTCDLQTCTCGRASPEKRTIGIQVSMDEILAELEQTNVQKDDSAAGKTAEMSIQVGNGLANLRNAKQKRKESTSSSSGAPAAKGPSTVHHMQPLKKRPRSVLSRQTSAEMPQCKKRAISTDSSVDLVNLGNPLGVDVNGQSVSTSGSINTTSMDSSINTHLPLSPPDSLEEFDLNLELSPLDSPQVNGLLPCLDCFDDFIMKTLPQPPPSTGFDPASYNCAVTTPITADLVANGTFGIFSNGGPAINNGGQTAIHYNPTGAANIIHDRPIFDLSEISPDIAELLNVQNPYSDIEPNNSIHTN